MKNYVSYNMMLGLFLYSCFTDNWPLIQPSFSKYLFNTIKNLQCKEDTYFCHNFHCNVIEPDDIHSMLCTTHKNLFLLRLSTIKECNINNSYPLRLFPILLLLLFYVFVYVFCFCFCFAHLLFC